MSGMKAKGALALGVALAMAGLASGGAEAQSARQDVRRADLPGRVIFQRQCAPCHGTGPGADGSPMLPGTAALAAKYQGSRPPELELRSDLPAPVLRLFVRRGSGAMPMFRPSELTDTQIGQIADYLAATARASN